MKRGSCSQYHRRIIGTVLWLATFSVPAQEPSKKAPPAGEGERKVFVRPLVPVALFTPEKTALLEPECERIASFLARYAAEKLTDDVLNGSATARARGRLLLTVSMHLQPMNPSAVHCGLRWLDGQRPSLPPPGEPLRVFSNFLLSAAQRQSDKPAPAREALARVLIRLAADLDPENEDAIYASELQDRDGKAPPLRELLDGTLGKAW
jgi:hypothetical protein